MNKVLLNVMERTQQCLFVREGKKGGMILHGSSLLLVGLCTAITPTVQMLSCEYLLHGILHVYIDENSGNKYRNGIYGSLLVLHKDTDMSVIRFSGMTMGLGISNPSPNIPPRRML